MTRSDHDPVSPRVRVVEAAEQLSQARNAFSEDDEELVAIFEEIIRDVDTMIELLDAQRDGGSRYFPRDERR